MAGIYIVFSIGSGFVQWLTFRYWMEDSEIQIRSGVFVKKNRHIPIERIHSIDTSEGVLQRIFSLVHLTLETAGSTGGEAEAVLTAIPKQDAEEIRMFYNRTKDLSRSVREMDAPAGEQVEELLFSMTYKQLLWMSITSGGAVAVFVGAAALLGQFSQSITAMDFNLLESVQSFAGTALFMVVALLVLFLVFLAYAAATVGVILKYANFTLHRRGGELIIRRGLLERRQLTIPSEKIQSIRVVENIIRQPFGLVTVYLETASGSEAEEGNAKVMLFPLVKKTEAEHLVSKVLAGYVFDSGLQSLPAKTAFRYVLRQWLWAFVIIGLSIYFFRPAGYFALLLLPVSGLWGYILYRAAGWKLDRDQLSFSYRLFLSKHTYLARKGRIQSLDVKQSYFQKGAGLTTVECVTKTGAGTSGGFIKDLEEEYADRIYEWFRS